MIVTTTTWRAEARRLSNRSPRSRAVSPWSRFENTGSDVSSVTPSVRSPPDATGSTHQMYSVRPATKPNGWSAGRPTIARRTRLHRETPGFRRPGPGFRRNRKCESHMTKAPAARLALTCELPDLISPHDRSRQGRVAGADSRGRACRSRRGAFPAPRIQVSS